MIDILTNLSLLDVYLLSCVLGGISVLVARNVYFPVEVDGGEMFSILFITFFPGVNIMSFIYGSGLVLRSVFLWLVEQLKKDIF